MKTYLFLLASLLGHLTTAQNVVYFPGFELINMEPTQGLQYSTSKLVKSYIEDNHSYTILLDDRIGNEGYLGRQSLQESVAQAAKMNARFFMRGEIHFLQGVFIISVGVYETASMEQVWHDMAKGAAEQDLDPLLSRIGRAFFSSKTAKTDIEIDEVTEYDQKGIELAQIKVNHFVGVMLGGKAIPNESTLSGFGLAYTYDASTVLFNFDFELFPSSTISINHSNPGQKMNSGGVSLGVTYPLSRKRSTFYLNGGMEYGYTTIKQAQDEWGDRASASGIGAYFGGGYLINRNSTVNLRIFTAVSVPFYHVDNTNVTGIKFGIVTSFAKKR
ncbi:MAG: hypothetical protein RLN88_05300 [Ekhidna sp.]|uniref:hypothetical protein n=1 Tax=Ekhidna sp. TaxID=2608089 RepID=UPI0032EDECC6